MARCIQLREDGHNHVALLELGESTMGDCREFNTLITLYSINQHPRVIRSY